MLVAARYAKWLVVSGGLAVMLADRFLGLGNDVSFVVEAVLTSLAVRQVPNVK